jgi:hypothetical protein
VADEADETRGILRGVEGTGLRGLWGRTHIPLDRYVDTAALPALHDEICLALAQMPVDYTGGSHRSMGIMPPGAEGQAGTDYGEVIHGLDDEGFAAFRSLADDPGAIDPARRHQETYGEEREHPLSRRQMHWLKYRHGVYFPWKVYVEMIPNRWWGDKADPAGKRFTRLAETLLPRTVAFVRSLPFAHIGRCNLMGLESNDHGTVHRDGDPAEQDAPDQFVTFCPGGPKALYLWDPERRERTPIAGRAYWFNDFDHHGVEAAPGVQYSIRVDGAFSDGFFATLARDFGGAP